MAKRQSMARKSKAGGGPRKSAAGGARKSAAGGQRKSMAKRQSTGGKRKSTAGKGSAHKQAGGEKTIGNKNARRGRDTFTYPNGDKYEGDWLAIYPDIFVRDGNAIMPMQIMPSNAIFIGVDQEGEGTYTCSDGTVYHGLWELDLLATGSIVWPCGQKYSGDFSNGKIYGIGTYTFPGRGELSGTFVDNKPVGNVVFLDKAGMKYIGKIAQDAQTVRLKMLNHLPGGFAKEELVLPDPPKGMDDDDDDKAGGTDKKKSSKGGPRKSRASRASRASKAGGKRQSKSKSVAGGKGKRQSMKRKSSVKQKK